jgi:hypothetical protein
VFGDAAAGNGRDQAWNVLDFLCPRALLRLGGVHRLQILEVTHVVLVIACDRSNLLYRVLPSSLVINTLVGLLLGPTAYYLALLYTGAVAVVFMANTLQHGISMSQHEHANPKRNYLLIGYGCSRCLG